MGIYQICLKDFDPAKGEYGVVDAASPAAAKYRYFLELDSLFETFSDFLRNVASVRKVSVAERRATSRQAAFDRVKKYRGVEFAEIGMRVLVGDRPGVILGANASANFDVDIGGVVCNVHPHAITYPEEARDE